MRIPSFIDPAIIAPLLCAGASVFNGIRHLQIPPGETLAIQGLGGLGHLAIQYASRMGYRVIALSSSASKRDFALSLGATEFVDGSKEDHAQYLQEKGGVACIVSTAPNANVVGQLIGGLAPNGKLLVLSRTYPFPPPPKKKKEEKEIGRNLTSFPLSSYWRNVNKHPNPHIKIHLGARAGCRRRSR